MSTFYYLCCRTDLRRGPLIAGRSFPDRWWGPSGHECNDLAEFVADHHRCGSLVVLSEHSVDDYVNVYDDTTA